MRRVSRRIQYSVRKWAFIALTVSVGTFDSSRAADISYYQVEISVSGRDENLRGYLKLDWSDANNLSGQICIPGFSRKRVTGRNVEPGKADLVFDGLQALGMPAEPISFVKEQIGHYALGNVVHWRERTDLPPSDGSSGRTDSERPSIDLYRIPDFRVSGGRTRDANRLSRLDIEQAFREELRDPTRSGGDGGIDPGRVSVLVRKDKVVELGRFVRTIKAGPVSKFTRANECDVPALVETLRVTPLLESWSAAKLEASGLVLSADIIVLPAGPGTIAFSTTAAQFTRVVSQDNRNVEQRDRDLSDQLQEMLTNFASSRRNQYRTQGRILRLFDGNPFFYRFQLKGLALARCEPNRWEKVVIQLFLHRSITEANKLGVVLQIQEGFFAPGSGAVLPPDSRFQENRIPDGDLEELQSTLATYLLRNGFSDESPGVNQVNVSCGN